MVTPVFPSQSRCGISGDILDGEAGAGSEGLGRGERAAVESGHASLLPTL